MMIMILVQLCLSYLLGAIPTGLIAGRLKGVDVRQHGSGNVGATNVTRVVGKAAGLVVLIIDLAKGWVPVAIVSTWSLGADPPPPEWLPILLGVAAVAGHIWNPFLQFQGGKWVATGLGVLVGLNVWIGLLCVAIWLLTFFFTRYVSVASTAAALVAPFLLLLFGRPTSWVLGGVAVSLAILARHRPNYLRLLQGEEHRVGSPPSSS